mmetsp:Transcript_35636/g.80034  ORF Transcript_35636/g.80034 Transcript_35636/m.80034 type:complete len:86 (+) Transcript_35636:158-415(+)
MPAIVGRVQANKNSESSEKQWSGGMEKLSYAPITVAWSSSHCHQLYGLTKKLRRILLMRLAKLATMCLLRASGIKPVPDVRCKRR